MCASSQSATNALRKSRTMPPAWSNQSDNARFKLHALSVRAEVSQTGGRSPPAKCPRPTEAPRADERGAYCSPVMTRSPSAQCLSKLSKSLDSPHMEDCGTGPV